MACTRTIHSASLSPQRSAHPILGLHLRLGSTGRAHGMVHRYSLILGSPNKLFSRSDHTHLFFFFWLTDHHQRLSLNLLPTWKQRPSSWLQHGPSVPTTSSLPTNTRLSRCWCRFTWHCVCGFIGPLEWSSGPSTSIEMACDLSHLARTTSTPSTRVRHRFHLWISPNPQTSLFHRTCLWRECHSQQSQERFLD